MRADDRLSHGYTNLTRRVAGAPVVEKTYSGSDALIRLHREAECLQRVAGVLPAPAVIGRDEGQKTLRLQWIGGVPGQQLLDEGSAREVLNATGALLLHLQQEATPLLTPVLQGAGTSAVHGDFGPQNLVFNGGYCVVALVDWEFAHMGDPVEDLAWAEWIVRMHHPVATSALDALFVGYGQHPDWPVRHTAMLEQCERHRERCAAEGLLDAEAMWRERLAATTGWHD